MSYQIAKQDGGQFAVTFTGEPDYCRALSMAPESMEPELAEGLWLVLVFAVWSVPDRRAIAVALTAVKDLGGRVRLGVRPCDDPGETTGWCPEVEDGGATPQWLVLRDGRLVDARVGLLPPDELAALLAQHLA
ncbi:MAG TPA: hypothetical protein VH877_06645 [Polyangia bacterium]|jgi:hypothetical protein|nr:hypothetical protein [Polyangia bacterium]